MGHHQIITPLRKRINRILDMSRWLDGNNTRVDDTKVPRPVDFTVRVYDTSVRQRKHRCSAERVIFRLTRIFDPFSVLGVGLHGRAGCDFGEDQVFVWGCSGHFTEEFGAFNSDQQIRLFFEIARVDDGECEWVGVVNMDGAA